MPPKVSTSLIVQDPSDQWEHYFKPELRAEADRENQEFLRELSGKYGAEWVWEHRRRLVDLMRYFVMSDIGHHAAGRA